MVVLRFTFLLIACFFLLISCSKDEPDTTFEGAWLFQATAKQQCSDSSKNSEKNGLFAYDSPCNSESRFLCRYERYIFKGATYSQSSSSTLFGIPISSNDEGTYTISGNTLTVCRERSSQEAECTVFEYSINGNTMSLAVKNPETGCLEIDFYGKQ